MKIRKRNNRDRLSDLPDCVLIHILSTFNAQQAVQTCILSKRWKNLWKLLPILSLVSISFKSISGVDKFISQLLSLRDDKIALHTLNFYSRRHWNHSLLKRVIDYAFSHNVKILEISTGCRKCFPLCYFSSHTLTSLIINSICWKIAFPNSLNLPALTNLSLRFLVLGSSDDKGYVEPFSAFKCLNTLTIGYCKVHDEENLFISSATLVELTIKCYGSYKFELSTPNLCSFDFTGNPLQELSESNNNLSSVKHVCIDVHTRKYEKEYPRVLLNWLTKLALIESLTVSSGTLEILNKVPNLWKGDFPYLCNLKSLNIIAYRPSSIHHEVYDRLLQNAPSAKKTIIDLSRSGAVKDSTKRL